MKTSENYILTRIFQEAVSPESGIGRKTYELVRFVDGKTFRTSSIDGMTLVDHYPPIISAQTLVFSRKESDVAALRTKRIQDLKTFIGGKKPRKPRSGKAYAKKVKPPKGIERLGLPESVLATLREIKI